MKTGTATETKMPPVKPREQQSESAEKVVIKVGQKLWKGDKIYSYAGVVKDAKSKDFGKPTVKLEGKDLYEVWTKEQVSRGLFCYESEELIKDIKEEIPELMKDHWEAECVNNAKNNPDNVKPPKF